MRNQFQFALELNAKPFLLLKVIRRVVEREYVKEGVIAFRSQKVLSVSVVGTSQNLSQSVNHIRALLDTQEVQAVVAGLNFLRKPVIVGSKHRDVDVIITGNVALMSNGPQKRPSLQVIHESVLPTNVANFEQYVEYDGLLLNRSFVMI